MALFCLPNQSQSDGHFLDTLFRDIDGIGLLRTRRDQFAFGTSARRSTARLLFDGAFSNVSNPKIALFLFAFLPQFVTPDAPRPTLSLFVLGLVFALPTKSQSLKRPTPVISDCGSLRNP